MTHDDAYLVEQDLLAENCRVLEESGSMHELRLSKEEIIVMRKHIQSMQQERISESEQHRNELQVSPQQPSRQLASRGEATDSRQWHRRSSGTWQSTACRRLRASERSPLPSSGHRNRLRPPSCAREDCTCPCALVVPSLSRRLLFDHVLLWNPLTLFLNARRMPWMTQSGCGGSAIRKWRARTCC